MNPHLLFLSDIPPWPAPLFGAQLRTARLVEQLSRAFRVTLMCSNDAGGRPLHVPGADRLDGVPRSAPKPGHRWGGPLDTLAGLVPARLHASVSESIPRALLPLLRDLKRTDPPPVVWAYHSYMAELARMAGFDQIVTDIDDFEHVVWRKDIESRGHYRRAALHRLSCVGLQRYEERLGRRFPALVVSKIQDIAIVEEHAEAARSLLAVVPNGIDVPLEVAPLTKAPTMLFVGKLSWPPNYDAIQWFIDYVLPRIRAEIPEANLIVAGRGPVPEVLQPYTSRPHVRFEVSPPEMANVYREARVAITPVRLGDGTKIKVLEAMAMGRPLVTTSDAARGHAIVENVHALVANEPAEFASACVRLLRDDALAERLATAGRAWVAQHGSWDRSGDAAIAVVKQLLHVSA